MLTRTETVILNNYRAMTLSAELLDKCAKIRAEIEEERDAYRRRLEIRRDLILSGLGKFELMAAPKATAQ